jgi:hypothetical protein
VSVSTVECGCRLVHRFDGKTEVHPCSEAHRETAMRVRQHGSSLIIKPVAR